MDRKDVRQLETQIKKNGYHYELVKRSADTLMYVQYLDKIKGKRIAYEVFKNKIRPLREELIRLHPESMEKYQDCPDFYETFPSDEEFGKRAWTYKTLEEALDKYDTLERLANCKK